MGLLEKHVKHEDTNEVVAQAHEHPDTVAECVKKYGESVVLSNLLVGIGTALRNRLYGLTHNKGRVSAEEAIKQTANWMPGEAVVRVAKDPMTGFLDSLKSSTPEERLEAIKELQARLTASDES